MKLFDVDWVSVLVGLRRWDGLLLPARRVMLDELKPHGYIPSHKLGAHLESIVATGIPEYDAAHKRVFVGDDQRELVKVLRAMDRHPVFDHPTPAQLMDYMAEHFTNEDIVVLGSGMPNRHSVAQRVARHTWAGDLLNARTAPKITAWVGARGMRIDHGSMDRIHDLQQLAHALLETPGGMPLRELVERYAKPGLSHLAGGLHLGLRTMVIFAGMRGADLEPVVGLWPDAVRELTRPAATPPTPVTPLETFVFAAQMEDMTAVLAAIAAEPVRLRANDRLVFARTRVDIEQRLVALPPWFAQVVSEREFPRVDGAARELQIRGLARIRMLEGNPHLEVTAAGLKWLAQAPRNRLEQLTSPARKSEEVNPPGAYDASQAAGFFPYTLPYYKPPTGIKLRIAITKAFLDTSGHYVSLAQFLDYHTRSANPFVAHTSYSAEDLRGMMYFGAADPRETFPPLWQACLHKFLAMRLVATGGAAVGLLSDGSLCFSLTDVGRYILGAADSFEYGVDEVAELVVQPNFDVVFLGAAPALEAQIARFAQRVGVAPGLTFRITRASVLAAAQGGATTDAVITALRIASSKPLPKNVEREITGWIASVRRARIRTAALIECADEESASRVAELLGGKARRLAPTIFELPPSPPAARSALLKRLRTGGVFLAEDSAVIEPKVRGRKGQELVDDVEPWDDAM